MHIVNTVGGIDLIEEQELARRAGAGDNDAFASIYERYFPGLYDFAARTLRDHDRAGDVVQNTFTEAWSALQRGTEPEHLKAWLFTIARHNALDEIRRTKRLVSTSAAGDEDLVLNFAQVDESRIDSPQEAAQDGEYSTLVWDAAAGMSAKEYTLLDMHLRQQLSADEIARALRVSPGNVHTMTTRLRQSLETSVSSLMLVRRGRGDCAELDALLTTLDADADLTPKIRRAVRKHVKACEICTANERKFVAPAEIFAGFGVLLAGAGVADRILGAVQASVAANAGAGSGGIASGVSTRIGDWWEFSTTGAKTTIGIAAGAAIAALIAVPLLLASGDSAPPAVAVAAAPARTQTAESDGDAEPATVVEEEPATPSPPAAVEEPDEDEAGEAAAPEEVAEEVAREAEETEEAVEQATPPMPAADPEPAAQAEPEPEPAPQPDPAPAPAPAPPPAPQPDPEPEPDPDPDPQPDPEPVPEPVPDPDPDPFLTLTPSATVIELAPGESGDVSVTFDFLGADQVDWSALAAFAPHLTVAAETTGVTDTGSGRGITISLHSIPIGGEPLTVTVTATSPDDPELQASVVITVTPIVPTILVLLYLDHQIPLTNLLFALPDQYCGDVHYHALVPPTATSLAGVEVTQPDPMGCGFGGRSSVVIEEIPDPSVFA